MGMDYQYAGSASYPRFDEELTKVAAVFGGKPSAYLEELNEADKNADWVTHMFGTISANRDVVEQKLVFPKETDQLLVNFFNYPYREYSPEETEKLWEMFEYHPEIENISNQIYHELQHLYMYGEGWRIS